MVVPFIRKTQLFLCFQDSTHIATKLRNRLLSETASLLIGSYKISIQDVENLIYNYSKMDHNLVISDVYVKDKQNYASCIKLSSENVLQLLNQGEETIGTYCYLSLLQFIIKAYIDKTTNILKRIYYAWFTIFFCCFRFMWLRFKLVDQTKTRKQKTERPSMKKIEEHFITFPIFYCIELNAHILTFILLSVLDNKLPPEALNIFLFSSQPCENMFRCARATTGPLSSINNFTVQEFLSKSRKLQY